MLSTFLYHQWKAFWRSRNKGGTIAVQIFMGFVVLYLLLIAVFLGLSVETMISKLLPGKDLMVVFNGLILYYFAADFIMRLQLQDLPTLSIVPYLHLNIARKEIVRFLNLRALFSAFNLFPLILFLPFCSTAIADIYSPLVATMYCLSVFSLCIFNNYAALYIKRLTVNSTKMIFAVVLCIGVLGALEYFKVFSIAAISHGVFEKVTAHPWLALLFTALAVAALIVNARYLRSHLYVEELGASEDKKTSTDYPFLSRFGQIGMLVALELKLIFRHKRSRSAIIMGVFFIFYGFLFYKEPLLASNSFGMMIFSAVFMTGSSISIYGQFMFGWQGSHFDGLLANKTNLKNFIKAKFLLFTFLSTLMTLIVSFYGFISWKIIVIQFAAYLYNIGIGTVIILYFATRNYKRIDLSRGSTLNYQGIGASQFMLILPYFLAPYLFYLPFAYMGKPFWGLIFLGGCGLVSLLMREAWIHFILQELNKRKYKIAAGFREK